MSSLPDRRARFESVVDVVYEPLQRYLLRRIGRNDFEDVFADTLATLWRRLDDIPATDPLPWCYGVARRTMANHFRARDRRLRLVDRLEAEAATAPGGEEPPAGASPEIEDETLGAAFAGLKPADQEILRLWAWEGLEPREVAVVLGLTANAATLRLSRARRKLELAMTRQIPAHAGHIAVEHTEELSDD